VSDPFVFRADERTALLGFIQFYRETVVAKVQGLDEEQVRFKPASASNSLLALINHLTGVEARWFRSAIKGEHVDGNREDEFFPPDTLTVAKAIANYRVAWQRSDRIARNVSSLDDMCKAEWASSRNVRWVLLHVLEETARHAGHADITRELIDGATGY
jgi:uncharacterized damage-inducible protein DinB